LAHGVIPKKGGAGPLLGDGPDSLAMACGYGRVMAVMGGLGAPVAQVTR